MRLRLPVSMIGGLAAAACATGAAKQGEAPAAPDREAILEAVDAFFVAMAANDADAMTATLAPGAIMVALGAGGDEPPPRRSSVAEFINRQMANEPPRVAHEAYWNPTVLQRKDLAVVWTPYRIDIDGVRRHCGVDVFNLSRENGAWMIDAISFTMEPEACPELEPEGVAARPVFPK